MSACTDYTVGLFAGPILATLLFVFMRFCSRRPFRWGCMYNSARQGLSAPLLLCTCRPLQLDTLFVESKQHVTASRIAHTLASELPATVDFNNKKTAPVRTRFSCVYCDIDAAVAVMHDKKLSPSFLYQFLTFSISLAFKTSGVTFSRF